MSALPSRDWTVDAYLEYERETNARHEFIDGQVMAMAGASERHNQIASALHYLMYSQFLNRPCQVFQSDMRVQVKQANFFYPDIVALCEAAQYADDKRDTLLNPAVIMEVLSPSTEDFDRGRKFAHYRELASLTDYVLVAQSQIQVEHYVRQTGDSWLLTVFRQPDDAVTLTSLNCILALRDIYRKVIFDDES